MGDWRRRLVVVVGGGGGGGEDYNLGKEEGELGRWGGNTQSL